MSSLSSVPEDIGWIAQRSTHCIMDTFVNNPGHHSLDWWLQRTHCGLQLSDEHIDHAKHITAIKTYA